MIKRVLVGGPLLGQKFNKQQQSKTLSNEERSDDSPSISTSMKNNILIDDENDSFVVPSWNTLEPIISDPIRVANSNSSSNQQKGGKINYERFIFLPTPRYVSVLAYKTGKRIATIVPNEPSVQIVCATVGTFPEQTTASTSLLASNIATTSSTSENHVLLLGCSNGTIQEYCISNLFSKDNQYHHNKKNNNEIQIPGPCFGPRRVFQVADNDVVIQHIAAVSFLRQQQQQVTSFDGDLLLYALTLKYRNKKNIEVLSSSTEELQDSSNEKNNRKIQGRLVRITIPSVHVQTTSTITTTATATRNTSSKTKKVKLSGSNSGTMIDLREEVVGGATNESSSLGRIYSLDNKLKFYSSYLPSSAKQQYKNAHQKKKKHDRSIQDEEDVMKFLPFRLLVTQVETSKSTSSPDVNISSIGIILASTTKLSIYYDPLMDSKSTSIQSTVESATVVHFDMYNIYRFKDLLSTVQISPNGLDLICGHNSGAIRIMINVIPAVVQYLKDLQSYNYPENQIQQEDDNNTMMIEETPTTAKMMKPIHPSTDLSKSGILIRKLHWHAQPVSTIQYDGTFGSDVTEGMLYSGGEESVLVTWQLSQGTYRPADFLPRISSGSIIHMVLACDRPGSGGGGDGMILVYCSDNSLQLFDSQNKNVQWKIQGLATKASITANSSYLMMDPYHYVSMHASIESTVRSSELSHKQQQILILSGLLNSPGCIHWYDPRTQTVISSLEIVPYNRVSRTEIEDIPIPSPMVTHAVWSNSTHHNDMITIDIVPTENSAVGRQQVLPDGQTYGITTNIRFWMKNKNADNTTSSSSNYQQVASMPYPHGRKNRVSAIAVSPDGNYVCTVSNDEKAFRLWQKFRVIRHRGDGDGYDDDNDSYNSDNDVRNISVKDVTSSPEWFCRCKVSTPAAFSNFLTGQSAVSFSHDSTVLVIGFGSTLTLWSFDNNNNDDAAAVMLLTCHRHGNEAPHSLVDHVQFVHSTRLPDTILSKSSTSVVMQSSYGETYGPEDFGWTWELPYDEKIVRISFAQFVPSHDLVAIALYDTESNISCIILVNALTGQLWHDKDVLGSSRGVLDNVPGEIVSLLSCEAKHHSNQWVPFGKSKKTMIQPFRIYALTNEGEMIVLSTMDETEEVSHPSTAMDSEESYEVPSVPLLTSTITKLAEQSAANNNQNKRTIVSLSDLEENRGGSNKKISLYNFGSVIGEDGKSTSVLPSTELPQLQGAFARCFIARNLQRRR